MEVVLRRHQKVFAWSYEDVPGVEPSIAEHAIPLKPGAMPVRQKLRRLRPEWAQLVKDEITKHIKSKFLEVVDYAEWVANVVPVGKKDGKVRVCVDYRDLNRACPKDNFPLPHIDVLVSSAASAVMYSLMDGFSGYNQILMKITDKVKTSFITEWGTYCYKVMPFGLKNAGATYQRAATTLLHDMIHKEVEVYVDDMLVKSDTREGHPATLEKFLMRIEKYNLRLNPKKCVFGVTSGKLLGHIVSDKGIEIDPEKVKAITEMPPSKIEKEVQAFLGSIQYVSRFIAKLTIVCEPIFKLLRKDETNQWNDNCQLAFDKIKKCLASASVLGPPSHYIWRWKMRQ
ncbi:Transposon Tf2-6 polyprotein [Euphorbia peplus]|nr:Transposon Tf2-6 polyprotein [Euphorbia peplus]